MTVLDDLIEDLASRLIDDRGEMEIYAPDDVEGDDSDDDDPDQTLRADLNPGDSNFKQYWVYGEGRARWNTFTELRNHLLEHVSPTKADRIAADWFHERYGFWPGDDRNRVRQGKPPRGDRIGPG